MTRRTWMALPAALAAALASQLHAEEKKKAGIRVSGTVKVLYKDKSAFDVSTRTGASRPVNYTAETKFTIRNKAAGVDDLKEGSRVICVGRDDGGKYVATRVDIRQ